MGNGPVSQDRSRWLSGITMAEICRIVSAVLDKPFDELEKNLDRMSEITDRMLRAIYFVSAFSRP